MLDPEQRGRRRNPMRIGEFIKFHRRKKSLTLLQMETLTGINNGALSKIESGKQGISEDTLLRIVGALGITLAELFSIEEQEETNRESTVVTFNVLRTYRSLASLPPGASVQIPQVEANSSNPGGMPTWTIREDNPLTFSVIAIRHLESMPLDLASIVVPDDSMRPRLFMGDEAIIDTSEKDVPATGGVFALVYGADLLIRRLFKRPGGGLMLSCDSSEFPSIDVRTEELPNLAIVGRIKYRGGSGDL
jgi:transcriptional regulator with XRE-family HTH domain